QQVFLFGSGAGKFENTFADKEHIHIVSDFRHSSRSMCALALQRFMDNSFEDLVYFEPFYLKEFIATSPRKTIQLRSIRSYANSLCIKRIRPTDTISPGAIYFRMRLVGKVTSRTSWFSLLSMSSKRISTALRPCSSGYCSILPKGGFSIYFNNG